MLSERHHKISQSGGGGVESYFRQSFVSLMSAERNTDCDRMVLVSDDLPDVWAKRFEDNGILVKKVNFVNYHMPKSFRWEFAFYKLCALEYMVEQTSYDMIVGTDTDVFFADSLDALWKECAYGLPILLPLSHVPLQDLTRNNIIEDYKKLTGKSKNLIQIGGEFVAGSKQALKRLVCKNQEIYKEIKKSGFDILYRRFTAKKMMPQKEAAARLFNLPKQNKYNFPMLKYYLYRFLQEGCHCFR